MKIARKSNYCQNSEAASKQTLPRPSKMGWSKYILPTEDIVPADRYFSKIMHIERTNTYLKEEAFAVYYSIAKFSDVYKKVNNLFEHNEKPNVLYIKQIYPLESDRYCAFMEAMYDALELDDDEEIPMDRCIGITENILIGYRSGSGIGGITDRCRWSKEDFEEYYQQQQQIYASSNDYYGIEYDEYGNMI